VIAADAGAGAATSAAANTTARATTAARIFLVVVVGAAIVASSAVIEFVVIDRSAKQLLASSLYSMWLCDGMSRVRGFNRRSMQQGDESTIEWGVRWWIHSCP
jgi:hypothetical protein